MGLKLNVLHMYAIWTASPPPTDIKIFHTTCAMFHDRKKFGENCIKNNVELD